MEETVTVGISIASTYEIIIQHTGRTVEKEAGSKGKQSFGRNPVICWYAHGKLRPALTSEVKIIKPYFGSQYGFFGRKV